MTCEHTANKIFSAKDGLFYNRLGDVHEEAYRRSHLFAIFVFCMLRSLSAWYLMYLPYHAILSLLRGFASLNETINVLPCGGGRNSLDHHHVPPLYMREEVFFVYSVVDFFSSSFYRLSLPTSLLMTWSGAFVWTLHSALYFVGD